MSDSPVTTALHELASSQTTHRHVAEVAKQLLGSIASARDFIEDKHHRIAFIGHMGAGKSSMISMLARMLVGDAPTDKAMLLENSVLAVGAGGTTICEVRIRSATPDEAGKIGLLSDPVTMEDMQREIEFFANDEWNRRKPNAAKTLDDNQDPTPREIQRAIRHMTGLQTHHETVQGKRRQIDPLDDVIRQHDSGNSLGKYLTDKAGLLTRSESAWWWDDNPEGYLEMKRRFDQVNAGKLVTAMLPRRLTLVVADPLPDSESGLALELVDTRGFDGHLEARGDLQEALRDPRALAVICTHFMEAPSDSLRSLMRSIQNDAELRSAAARILIVLMDHDHSGQVNGAGGDRQLGQEIKLQECLRALSPVESEFFGKNEVFCAFDTLKDGHEAMVRILDSRLVGLRSAVQNNLDQQVKDAASFLDNIESKRIELARRRVDDQLLRMLEAHRPQGTPLRDPLVGLYSGIRQCRYASQVLASCRRFGLYDTMDAYASTRSGASRATAEWLGEAYSAVLAELKALEIEPELTDVAGHIRLRRKQFEEGYIALIADYAERVRSDVEVLLKRDFVWSDCAQEWGKGPGFKERVIDHLEKWGRRQALSAHGIANPNLLLPFSSEKD